VLKRYRRTAEGATRATANVYLLAEHGIRSAAIDAGAAGICQRLTRAGHEAYIVGGAVRDLLTGRIPKDFDIATGARPRQVAGLFRGARVIGRRFKLVHVPSGARVFEVATFRGSDPTTANRYGTMDQDAFRRDFTFNALYYAPRAERLIDYVGGFQDIERRSLHTVGAPEASFVEDPVRMIRAVKYARLAGFTMERRYRVLISRHAGRLAECSAERLTEELAKILSGGRAAPILDFAHRLGLFAALLPQLAAPAGPRLRSSDMGRRLVELDRQVTRDQPPGSRELRTLMFATLLVEVAVEDPSWQLEERPEKGLAQRLRRAMEPLVLPQVDALRVAARLARDAAGDGLTPLPRAGSPPGGAADGPPPPAAGLGGA
jgi:poly(A) polymerase